MNKFFKCVVYNAVFWFRKRIIHKVFGLRHQIYNYNKKSKVMFWTNLFKVLKDYFRFFICQHPATHSSQFADLARCRCTKRKPILVYSFMWTSQCIEKSHFNLFLLLLIQDVQSTTSGLGKKKHSNPKIIKKHTKKPQQQQNLTTEKT